MFLTCPVGGNLEDLCTIYKTLLCLPGLNTKHVFTFLGCSKLFQNVSDYKEYKLRPIIKLILANVQPRSQGLFPGGWPGPFLSEKSSKHTRLVSLTILIEPSRGVSKYLTQPILHFRSGSLELLQQQQQVLFV